MKNFSRLLVSWFIKNQRTLPWRKTKDPYKIWISEIMLQQTTVSAVIPYYERWIKRFPDVHSLSRASEAAVLKQWQGLGYYHRARNVHKSAKIVVERFQGRIPCCKEMLRLLPGFGPYTTGAVLSIAFGQREPIVDANVRRVVMRLEAIRGTADPSKDNKIRALLSKILPRKNMSEFNQGLMELGALICRSQAALCQQCPLRCCCKAYAKGLQDIIPRARKTTTILKNVALAVIEHEGQFFIQKRPARGLLANFWEFPGGEQKKGEQIPQTLAREVREEIKVRVVSSQPLKPVKHFYTKFCVNLYPFLCTVTPMPRTDQTHRFVSFQELERYPLPSGTVKIIENMKKGLR